MSPLARKCGFADSDCCMWLQRLVLQRLTADKKPRGLKRLYLIHCATNLGPCETYLKIFPRILISKQIGRGSVHLLGFATRMPLTLAVKERASPGLRTMLRREVLLCRAR